MGIGPWSLEPELLLVYVYVCVCVCVLALESWFLFQAVLSACRTRDAQRAGEVWRSRQNSHCWRLEGSGPPNTVHPPRGKKKRKEGASKSFSPGSASSALPRTLSGGTRLLRCRAPRPQPARPPSQGWRSRLLAPPPPSARPHGSQLWDRRARLAVDGRAPARAKRRGAAQQPTDERLTADAGYLSVRPRVGRPTGSACWLGAGARGTRPSPSPPGSGTGFCREGGHFPTLPLPLLAERAAGGLRGPELPASHPAPRFSSRPLSPATFRALFSGWKWFTEASWTGSPPGGKSPGLRCVTFSSTHQLWMETNKEESILHEPLLRRREAFCSREGAAARVGSRWQGDGEAEGRETFISRLDSNDVCSWSAETDTAAALGNLEGLKASSVVYNSWIETKGHKGLQGADENWVWEFFVKSALGTTAVRWFSKSRSCKELIVMELERSEVAELQEPRVVFLIQRWPVSNPGSGIATPHYVQLGYSHRRNSRSLL